MIRALLLALTTSLIFIPALANAGSDDRSKDYDSTGYGGRGNDNASNQMRDLEKQEEADKQSQQGTPPSTPTPTQNSKSN